MKRNHLVIAIVIAALCALMAVPAANAATAKPAQVKGVTAKAASATSVKVTWKAVAKAKGYKVRYSTKANMKGAKTVIVKGAKKKAKTLTKLSGCTTYYVQVCAYKSAKALGKWSAKKAVKTAHTYKQVAAKAATCTAAGYTAHKRCAVCGATLNKKTVKALGHNYVASVVEPTVIDDGCTTHTCSRCGDNYIDNFTAHIVRDNTEAYSWAELKLIANKISMYTTKEGALEVAKEYNLLAADGKLTGDEVKTITTPARASENDDCVDTDVQVQILGFWHDDKADGSGKAGITFGFKQVVERRSVNSTFDNDGGWEKCSIRTFLNGDFYNNLPEDLKTQIVEVSKLTNNKGTTTDVSKVTATSDKVWLPSFRECLGDWVGSATDCKPVYDAEGAQYQLYSDNGVTYSSHAFLLKYKVDGVAGGWRLRSPRADSYEMYVTISDKSEWNYVTSNTIGGISPAFCL